MKRKGNLYPIVYDKETILKAIMEASKGKRRRRDVKKILANKEKYAEDLHKILKEERFVPSGYQHETVKDGASKKEREIYKPKFYPDQVVHWCIYLAIRDWIYRGMYEFSCGSVPSRGVHYGKKYVRKWIDTDHKNTKYYLKMDVRKFYPSISPDRLMKKIETKIKDPKMLKILGDILYQTDGLPIGMLLSQVFANFFATDIDFFIKQELGAVHYIRYMDDMVVFGRNKRQLHKMRIAIQQKLADNGLTLKSNWQVCKLDNEPLDFMGFRFYRYRTTLRKSIMLRIVRKVKKVYRKGRRATYSDACAIISYLGWIKHSNSHGLFVKWIQPYIHLRRLKDIIRKEQRRQYEILHQSEHCVPA